MLRAGETEDGSMPVAPERSGGRRSLMVGCGAVAGLAALLVAVGLALSRHGRAEPARADTAVLPDGSLVRLEAVTYGKQHRWELEKGAFAWLKAWLRPPVRRLDNFVEVTAFRDSAVFWITRRDAERPRTTLDMAWWTDYEILDEHGCRFGDGRREYRMQGPGGVSSSSAGRGKRVSPFRRDRDAVHVGRSGALAAFPRLSSAWTLLLYGSAKRPVAELSATNPVPGVYPSWTPEPLPATHRDGDLAVTLVSVSGIEHVNASQGRPIPQRDLQTRFELRQRGQPAGEWEDGEISLSDATGNQSSVWTVSLCDREAAWKLRAEFWRKPSARFAASETWSVSGVSAPGPGQVARLSGATTLKGVTIELLGIAGPGRFTYTNGVPAAKPITAKELRRIRAGHGVAVGGSTGSSGAGTYTTRTDVDAGRSHLALRALGLSTNQRLMVRATDERGRVFLGDRQAQMNHEQFWVLDIPEDARSLKLTFVVHSCRTVEFMIAPPKFTRRGGS